MAYVYIVLMISISAINMYLSFYNESGLLPANFGFLSYAFIGHISVSVASIWYLGFAFGMVAILLYIFGILDSSLTWWIRYLYMKKHPKLSMSVYNFFMILIPLNFIFVILSVFVTDYKNLQEKIMNANETILIAVTCILVVGYFIHIAVRKKAIANMGHE